MKMKDLKVGEEYALAAATSTYENGNPTQARVVAVGVHGLSHNNGWSGAAVSERASYVEYEIVGDARGSGSNWKHEVQVREDNGKIYRAPRFVSAKDRPEPPATRKVLRAPASSFREPWVDFAARRDRQRAATAKRQEKEGAEDARMDAALGTLKERLGITAWGKKRLGNGTLLASIGLEDMEQIAEFIDDHHPNREGTR